MHRILIIAICLWSQSFGISLFVEGDFSVGRAAYAIAPAQSEHEFRLWKSANGKYRIYAQLIRVQEGKVKLRQDTGKIINVSISKLSRFDREYVESIEGGTENPFSNAEESNSTMRQGSPQVRSTNKLIRSLNSAQKKLLQPDHWLVEPDNAKRQTTGSTGNPIRFRKYLDERMAAMVDDVSVGLGGEFMGVVREDSSDDTTELTTFNLLSGELKGSIKLKQRSTKASVAITPNGKHAAVSFQGAGRDNGRIDFVELGTNPNVIASWQTSSFFQRDGEPFRPERGIFLTDDRLLTIDNTFAGVWDWRRGEAIYAFEIDFHTDIGVSPNGKQIAVHTKSEDIAILDSSSGEVLGVVDGLRVSHGLNFSPDGTLLAGIDTLSSSVWIYDLAENKIKNRIGISQGVPWIHWVDQQHLLVGGSDLVDINLGVSVWKYRMKGIGKLANTHDGRFWLVTSNQVTPVNLLIPEVRDSLAQLSENQLNPDDLKLLKPGAEISVTLDISFEQDEVLRIRNELVDKLESKGLIIRDDAAIQLSLKLVNEKEKELVIGSMFPKHRMPPMPRLPGMPAIPSFRDRAGLPEDKPDEKVTARPKTGSIVLKRFNRVLWKKTRFFGPMEHDIIHRRGDETGQQAVDRLCTANPRFFTEWSLPTSHAQLPSGKPFGRSVISEQGVQ
jgi:hypothetical protein